MRVHLIKKRSIIDWTIRHAQGRVSFSNWLAIVKRADWRMPENILDTFSNADILGNGTDRVVFNIAGNRYRMICTYHFGHANVHLYINWIGTHEAYSKICKKEKQYTINAF